MEVKNYNKVGLKFMAIAFFPVFLHIFLLIINFIKYRNLIFSKADLIIIAFLIFYSFGLLLTRKHKEHFLHLALIAYSFFLSIFIVEIGLRIAEYDKPYLPTHEIIYPTEGLLPGVYGKVEFSINKFGLRGPEIDLNKADIAILVVGGSTAECHYITDKLSWPWRLQDLLAQESGKVVFVGNSARSGHFTLNHIYFLKKYHLAPKFDWVIVLAGLNDAGRLLHNDYEALKRDVENQAFRTYVRSAFYMRMRLFSKLGVIYNSILLPNTVVQDPWGKWHDMARKKRRLALKKHTISQIPAGLNTSILIYRGNLKEIISICRERNQKLIMLTHPTMWRKELPASYQSLLWHIKDDNSAYSLEVLEEVMIAYNQATIEVCKEQGTYCIDLASILAGDYSIFYDDAHFNIYGCEVIAKILKNEIVKMEDFKELY